MIIPENIKTQYLARFDELISDRTREPKARTISRIRFIRISAWP